MALNGATSTTTLVPATAPAGIKPGPAIFLDRHGHFKHVEHLLYTTVLVAIVKEEELLPFRTMPFSQGQHILVNTLRETLDLENLIQKDFI